MNLAALVVLLLYSSNSTQLFALIPSCLNVWRHEPVAQFDIAATPQYNVWLTQKQTVSAYAVISWGKKTWTEKPRQRLASWKVCLNSLGPVKANIQHTEGNWTVYVQFFCEAQLLLPKLQSGTSGLFTGEDVWKVENSSLVWMESQNGREEKICVPKFYPH